MYLKLAAVAALSMALCAGAMAQTSADGDQDSGKASIPSAWVGPIGEAFYTDGTGLALRPEAEAKANFAALSPDLQAQVKSDCMAMAEPMDKTGSTATGADANAGSGATDATAAQAGTASQICMWVGQN